MWYDENIINYEDIDITLHLKNYEKFFVVDKPLRIQYIHIVPRSTPRSASIASAQLVPFFERFFKKNVDLYQEVDNRAMVWLYRVGGLLYAQVGQIRQGRKMFRKSLSFEKDLAITIFFFVTFLGNLFFRFFFAAKSRLMRIIRSRYIRNVQF